MKQEIEQLKKLITDLSLQRKEILNFKEACQFLDLSESHLYKMTSTNSIPHFKPNGKKVYFSREALEGWVMGTLETNPEVTEVLVTAQELVSDEERGKANLIYLETPCGFHIALDASYIDQVGDFTITLPTGETVSTSLINGN
jgi:excisionase family DNA binding protein